MTAAEQSQLNRERASRDLERIKILRANREFNEYFLARLRMKHEAIAEKFRTEPPDKCSHEEREILRRLMLEYENEILGMMDADEAAAQRTLSTR